MSKREISSKIKDFFKRNVLLKEIENILDFKPDTLFGIDSVSGEKLEKENIKSIKDLANIDVKNPPEIKGIIPQIIIKWAKVAKVLEKVVMKEIKEHKKILLIGLDNGGKTSILSVLQNKFSIIKDLLPTKGVKREKLDFFGYPIYSWDLGGQIVFRNQYYFKKPGLYFGNVDLMLYVIDIQDPERFMESAEYFRKVLEILGQLKENPPILIALHKSDQDVRRTLTWQKNIDAVKNRFNFIVDKFERFKAEFCDTTIFQKETIMNMFSTALTKISETSEIIDNILEDFTMQIEGRALSLISMDGIIFGSYTKSETDDKLVNNSALLLQTLTNFHNSIGLVREKSIVLSLPLNKVVLRGEKLFEYSDLQIPVYLWLLSEKPEKLEEKLEYFKNQLLPLINMFI